MKVGEGGRTFGSISTKEIAAEAKKQLGYDLDKKKMHCEPIKNLGFHDVAIKVHPQVTATLRVKVEENKRAYLWMKHLSRKCSRTARRQNSL